MGAESDPPNSPQEIGEESPQAGEDSTVLEANEGQASSSERTDTDSPTGDEPRDRQQGSPEETNDSESAQDSASTESREEPEASSQSESQEPADAPEANEPGETQGDSDPASQPDPGASSRPGELSDRESTPTSKTIDLRITNWGRPAAGEGIEIRTRHPRFPDTLAVFRREFNATVVIDFGPEGFVRFADFERVKVGKRTLVRNTGNPEADRVILLCVYNWTAKGKEIEALRDRGPDARVTIRMEMRIRP